ncbi:LppX_LprAFG lipoprotein [Mycobacterium vicinigordonae]|uniref:LppX_LprAFG lipoprotein n=1 Tax=Mycobacterium vicinigordonae TaxID=1719132 RepID=UPI00248406B3|nr:LppX_LprAFG lipoprotein [Mycobacterium vicinigordonae]
MEARTRLPRPRLRRRLVPLPRRRPPVRRRRPRRKPSSCCRTASKATTGLHSLHVNLQTADITTLPMESVNADVTNQPQELGGQAVGDAMIRLQPQAPAVPKQFVVTKKTMYTKDDTGKYTSAGPADKDLRPGV